MSERKAKEQRKTQVDAPKASVKHKGSNGFNAILIAVVVIVLGLGCFALVRSYEPKTAADDQAADSAPQTQTVADYAGTVGMTAEEFLAAYGLDSNESITADTDINIACNAMTVEKFAEYSSVAVDELKEQYGLGDDVTNDMIWEDAQGYMTVQKAAEMSGMDYSQLLEMYQLTEEQLPADMKIKDAEPIMEEAYQKMMAEQEAAQAEGDADSGADSDADAETAPEEAE